MPHSTPSATTTIDGHGARVEAEFAVVSEGRLAVRYRVSNTGGAPLAIFDRGQRQAVLAGRQQAGAVAAPTFEQASDGDVILRHVAIAGGQGRPTGPTVAATPLALRLAAGATLDGAFDADVPLPGPLRRVRWCLGVAPFDAEAFVLPERVEAGEFWQATDRAIATQAVLCTPWFDLAKGAFTGMGA